MKCIKNVHTEEIRRVRDGQARTYVELGDWNYIPKEEWKAARKATAEKKIAAEKAAKKKTTTKKATTKAVDNSRVGKKHRSRRQRNRPQAQKRVSNG